jgi:ligand-binding SRPBCC domain-containing protein
VHTHKFSAAEGGTLLRDEVQIELPLGALGWPAWPLVRRKLHRLFGYRHAVTRAACGGAT